MTDWPDAPNPVEDATAPPQTACSAFDDHPTAWAVFDRCGLALARIWRSGDINLLHLALANLLEMSPETQGTTEKERQWLWRDRQVMAGQAGSVPTAAPGKPS